MRDPVTTTPGSGPTIALVHLSGTHRGATRRLQRPRITIGSDADHDVPATGDGLLASLEHRGPGYEIIAAPGAAVWVNGERVRRSLLASGDVLEVGQDVLRYRVYPAGSSAYKSVRDVFSDCVGCVRYGGRGFVDRLLVAVLGPLRELATQISPTARVLLLALVVGSIGASAVAWQRSVLLQRQVRAQLEQIQGLEALLAGAGQRAFTRADFDSARQELDFRINDTLARIEALENRVGARGRVIEEASSATVILLGAYGFVEPRSGRPLRVAATPGTGLPGGGPGITLTGDGAEIEILYTGSGFVAGDGTTVVTNRHVAEPWAFDVVARRIVERGFEPVMRRFVAYPSGDADPFELRTLRTHESADIAVLEGDVPSGIPPLPLAAEEPAVGAEVIVLGYPTGMRALLARADPDWVADLLAGGELGFWELADALAEAGQIEPLATVGVVGQLTPSAVVYDADTTHGGSGGPVLDLTGAVVAVNASVLQDFSGSNLGVPASFVLDLLGAEDR